MNLENPRCGRCEGQRFWHVHEVADAYTAAYTRGPGLGGFKPRPVRARTNAAGDSEGVGHFETLVCRRCGFTTWYAIDWQGPTGITHPSSCVECKRGTAHVDLPAIEFDTETAVEPARITRGLLGREGFLDLSICTVCDRVSWRGRDYQHLDRAHFVRYRHASETERPCLACRATEALLDDEVHESAEIDLYVAVREQPFFFGWLKYTTTTGHFQIRVCKPCGSVEWYARGIERLEADPSRGITAIGDEKQAVSLGGPYR